MLRLFTPYTLVVILFTACDRFDFGFNDRNANRVGYREVGEVQACACMKNDDAGLDVEAVKDKRPTEEGGKFLRWANAFQVETGVGLHIIDYADKRSGKAGFLNIPGCQEVALKREMPFTRILFEDIARWCWIPSAFPGCEDQKQDAQHLPRK